MEIIIMISYKGIFMFVLAERIRQLDSGLISQEYDAKTIVQQLPMLMQEKLSQDCGVTRLNGQMESFLQLEPM